ncbi:magnesium transporter NIPA [Gregarina niphandrodes]|uniref:Magnesium transporter NIPA n=1 Tax=Gregarina niphandrodes TaxID=110365 RepID=A0A023B9P4_GRENI|nr:magnesium transporter NIPA [Gregarina niphandrodes]EZG73529.1 magnesium transporter NIPA [Gregarina niphandrodes]|eukprot:XP_011129649.1 magnesium transporter NIPA [Gregarina niphandrodes]
MTHYAMTHYDMVVVNWEYENEFIRHFEREDYLSDNYIKLTPVVSQGNEASRPVHHSVAMALLAGIFGSQTVCEIKEMQAYWELAGLTVLTLPTFYLALVLLVSAAVCQFPLLSKAIESSSGNAVIPTATYHSSWCIFSVIGGSIKFKEYEGLPISRILLFALGISIVVVSTYITSTAMTLHPADSKGSTLLIGPLLPPWPKQDPLRD